MTRGTKKITKPVKPMPRLPKTWGSVVGNKPVKRTKPATGIRYVWTTVSFKTNEEREEVRFSGEGKTVDPLSRELAAALLDCMMHARNLSDDKADYFSRLIADAEKP